MGTLVYWWLLASWRMQRGRWLLAILAVASGVAMGLAIQLVNASALEEFRDAISQVNGDAQIQLIAPNGSMDETIWPIIANAPEVEAASPIIDLSLGVSRQGALRIIGLDPLRAALVTPSLMPLPGKRGDPAKQSQAGSPLFDADSIFLSDSARKQLGDMVDGTNFSLPFGLRKLVFHVAGAIPLIGTEPIAVVDIATAQTAFALVGKLHRVDLKLNPKMPRALAIERLQSNLARAGWPQLKLISAAATTQRMSNLSRAYRVNLSVLALVALFTGGFLVWSALSLAVRRQRPTLALLGVLGLRAPQLAALVAAQGLGIALLGSLLGAAMGVGTSALLLAALGSDLGGGYFGGTVALRPDPSAILAYVALGLLVGTLASVAPAWATARQTPAITLRNVEGNAESAAYRRRSLYLAGALFGSGTLLLQAPPIADLPIAAYLAIALWLLAGIAAVPSVASLTTQITLRLVTSMSTLARAQKEGSAREPDAIAMHAARWLALYRIAQAPSQAATAVAGVVVSFALGCAMAIMVQSFRQSVADWLDNVLPADLYLRAAAAGNQGALDAGLQERLKAVSGIAKIEFLRHRELIIDPERPAVALLVRDIDPADPGAKLPLIGAALAVSPGKVPLWVSESLARRNQLQIGAPYSLPLGGAGAATEFIIAGVWRDYARQHGAISISRNDYQRLTGDNSVSDAAIWRTPGAAEDSVIAAVRATLPPNAPFEIRSASDIRALSLRIFDRSFAVTYALEAAAIGVGLIGIAAAFGGQALARRHEFGVLRHLGASRRTLRWQLAIEAAAIAAIGTIWGALIGVAIAGVLIEWVNPQSFGWTMQWSMPWALLAATAITLISAAVLAALWASRSTLSADPVRALREDW
jgi:putative ABC transport system permease protein